MEIKKILQSGKNKIVVVPKNCEMKVGDYVRIEKISPTSQTQMKAVDGNG